MLRVLLLLGLIFTLAACASTSTQEPEPAPEPAPVAAPEPTAEPEPVPVVDSQPIDTPMLPKTASSMPAVGLTGVAALAGAGMLGALRRRLR
jgi:LPXTG-motif cell wall-anchored protein